MDVTFRPPSVGNTVVPIRYTGAGTLDLEDDGIHVTAARATGRGRGALAAVTLIAMGVLGYVLQHVAGLSSFVTYGIIGGLAAGVWIPVLRKPAQEGERVEQIFPWANIKKVTWDATTECMIVIVKGMKPKGGLYVLQPKESPLQKQIEKHLASQR